MGTLIEAAATELHRGHLFGRGALHLTDAAASTCLRRSHHDADDLDLLINAGLYRDHNTAEPALASIIQEDIGANPGSPIRAGAHGTFSFDIMNGGCGVVTGLELLDGFVGSGAARVAMLVAADVDPSPRTSHGFAFSPAGGALVVAHTDRAVGFERIAFRTFAEDAGLFDAHLRWDPHAGLAHRGRNVVEIREAPEFADRCIEHAVDVAREVLASAGLAVADVDLLIASQYPLGFAVHVAHRLGIDDARVPAVARDLVGSHTVGPIAALEAAIASRQFSRARHTLFVTAGAGITIGVALYRGVQRVHREGLTWSPGD